MHFFQDLCKGMYDAYKNNNNRLPYGHLNNLLKEVKPNEDVPAVVGMKKDDSLLSDPSNVSSAVKSIGRPVGSTV